MKRYIKNDFLLYKLFFILVVFITGCKKESAFQYPPKPNVAVNANDPRFRNKLIHFVKDSVYILSSSISIDSGKVFTLDAGSLVKIDPNVSITIMPGASIEAKGTATEPVVFTSSAEKGKAGFRLDIGTWDGLRILGNTNGSSSGILNYIRIEFAGQYQGSLLLSGVSKATTLANIQVSYSFAQPSFEFIGGNCNAANLLSYASGGTDFYIHNGSKANLQNLLAYRNPFFASNGGGNFAGVDIEGNSTLPTISNLTVLGPSFKYGINPGYVTGSPQRRAALITAGGAKFHIRNSAFIGYPKKTYYLDDTGTAMPLQSGESDFTYCIINPPDTANPFYLPDNVYPPYNSNDLKSFLLEARFHNEIIADAGQLLLANPYNYFDGIPDPLPKAGSPLLSGADFNDASSFFKDPFFKQVVYRGALGTENWMQGWVNFVPLQTDYNN